MGWLSLCSPLVGTVRSKELGRAGVQPVLEARGHSAMVRQTFSAVTSLKWVVENVASMDPDACDQISSVLQVLPLRLDPADVLPYSRPRLAWISEEPTETDGSLLSRRKGFVEGTMRATGVTESQ